MKMNETSIKIIKNTFAQSGGKFLSVGLSVITVALLTRYLGADGYGNFSLIFSYLAFFGVISDFGMQLAVVRELSSTGTEVFKLYGTYLWLKALLVFISNILALAVLVFFPYSAELKLGIVIGSLAVSISGMMGYFNAIFQTRIRLDLLALVDIITKLVTVATIISFVLLKLNYYFIVSSVLIGNLTGFSIALYILRDTISLHFDHYLAKRLMIISLPIGITSFISTLYFKVDTVILSLYRSTSEVGIYSLAYKILENIIVFWGFYMASVYPLMAKFRSLDNKKYNSLFQSSIIASVVVSVPLVSVLFYFSPLIVGVFGGNGFSGAIVSLRILLISIPILLVNNIFYNFYVLERKNIIISIAIVVSLIANIWMNILYIPHYSYIGASYTTVVSAFILFLCYFIGLKFYKKVKEL